MAHQRLHCRSDQEEESVMAVTRRSLIQILSVAPAAAELEAQTQSHDHPAPPAPAATAYKRKIVDDHQWRTMRVLCDLIIPADERSGSATQAGVPEFIDDWLDFRGGHLLAEIRGGLTWLDMECNRRFNHDFADCADAERKQILDRIAYPDKAAPEDASAVAFFNQLRGLVVSGFFSSEMGVKDLPY